MKTTRNKVFTALTILTVIGGLLLNSGCKKDDDTVIPQKTTYDLKVKDVIGVNGTVTFTEKSGTVTTVEIVLNNVTSGTHPAHIHLNSAVETGGIAVTLNPVDATGKSTTDVTKKDDNTAINYSQLIAFDGYINVHESSTNLATVIAQGDIGGNALTGTNKTYNLTAVTPGVWGTAKFEQRKNGNTLVTIDLDGTLPGGVHPSHIHLGSVATIGGGPIKRMLSDVDGATGMSYTNIRTLDDNTAITYDNWLVYDGYINVHLSSANLATILCQGNIGSN